jgi:hypothetical protein
MSLRNNQSDQFGGIFIYIFVGIALFALLAFTFSRSQQSTSTTVLTTGQVKMAASQILSYQKSISTTIEKLLAQGCSETEISFQNDYVAGYTNPLTPPDMSCRVFSPGKGKVAWKKPPSIVPTPDGQYFFSNTRFSGLGQNAGGLADLDLAIWLRMVPAEVCRELNTQLNSRLAPPRAADSNGIPIEDNNPNFTFNVATNVNIFFMGAYNFSDYGGDSESGTGIEGRCIRQHNTAEYIYIGILLVR